MDNRIIQIISLRRLHTIYIKWLLSMPVYHGIEKDDNSEEVGMLKLVK